MGRGTVFSASLLFLVIGASSCSRTPESPARVYASGELPAPPEQNRPWKAPETRIPKLFVDAAAVLFRQGLSDPRGCEYRRITLATDRSLGRPEDNIPLAGWVLPAPPGEKQRFAIWWDGLVWPVASVGDNVDLRQDVLDAIARGEKKLADAESHWTGGSESYFNPDKPAFRYFPTLTEHLPCLLLRLGETDLAERVYDKVAPPPAPKRSGPAMATYANRLKAAKALDPDDPYLDLGGDMAYMLFSRMIQAHHQGRDADALACGHALKSMSDAVEAEAARRGFPRWTKPPAQPPPVVREVRDFLHMPAPKGKPLPYLMFLRQFPDILADQERRARTPHRATVVAQGLDKFPDREKRIAALIEDLDQDASAGGLSPTTTALAREGDDAIPPLLDCLRHDDRLTRSFVWFHTNGPRSHKIMRVSDAACAGIEIILNKGPHQVPGTEDHTAQERAKLADDFEARWKASKRK